MALTVAFRDGGDDRRPFEVPAGVDVVDRERSADLVVVTSEAAFRSLAEDLPSGPVLPVEADVGRHGHTDDEARSLLDALAADPSTLGSRTAAHPVLSATVDGVEACGVLDAALVTSEPARISEFTVTDPTGELETVRADGVVVSTPAGSTGYSHAAGGPILTSGAGVAVVPISPYTTHPSTWVVDLPVTVTVVRDETPVSLVVDGRACHRVGVEDTIRIDRRSTVDLVRGPGRRAGKLEKL